MALITKNFRVNALANLFAGAVYHDVTTRNGGDWFPMNVGNKAIEVAITGGVKGIRMLWTAICWKPCNNNPGRGNRQRYGYWSNVPRTALSPGSGARYGRA